MPIETADTPRGRIIREDLKIYIGTFLESYLERNHTTIFYEFNPAKGDPQRCTSCNGDNPVILRFERDHNANVFYDAFCAKCSPKDILEKISQG